LAILQYNVSGELKYLCSGSLITDMYVLTAAHCIAYTFNNSAVKLVGLRLGEYDLASEADCSLNNVTVRCPGSTRDYAIAQILIHSGFDPRDRTGYRNDIALVRLQTRAQSSDYVKTVCLPVPGWQSTKNGALVGLNLTVAGWGMTINSTESNILMKVDVPYLEPKICEYSLRGRMVLPGQLCAGGMAAMNACEGDSGGPLVASIFRNGDTHICYQVGIVSFGFRTCLSPFPSVYTNVEDFMPWILDHIRD
jgi:secreted trypsin-like serine protease